MSLDRLFLWLICIALGLMAVFWIGALFASAFSLGPLAGVPAIFVTGLAGYVAWRLIRDRVGNPEEDHYDSMDH